jgi:diguanylate cyclase (GGDEF)-like protein
MGGLVTMMTARELNLSDQLRAAAATDPLTGLLNRRSFIPTMRSLVATSNAAAHPLTLVIVDVDHFKRVNDTYGHGVGDHALQTLADILTEQSRADDVVCRLGGEEFSVVLPGCSEESAQTYIERVAAALATTPVIPGLTLSVSAGICTASEADGDADALIERADQALYRAKQAGRRRFATWRPVIEVGPPLPNAGDSADLARSSDAILTTADRQSAR